MLRGSRLVRSSFAILALASLADVRACDKSTAPAFVELRLTQPLIMPESGDASTRVTVREDGCVLTHYPAYDTRHGDYAYRLAADELQALRADIAASGVAHFDTTVVTQDLQRRETIKRNTPNAVRHHVSDEAVVEISIVKPAGPAGARHTIRWSGIEGQRRNHPELASIAGLAAARDRLLQLGTDGRMQKVLP